SSPQPLVDQRKLIGPRSALLRERKRKKDVRRKPMLFFKYVFLVAGFGALAGAVASAIYDLYREWEHRRRLPTLAEGAAKPTAPPYPRQSASACGRRNRAPGRLERLPRARAQLHGARSIRHPPRRDPAASGFGNRQAAGRGRHRGRRGYAARYSASRRICARPGGAPLKGTGERSLGYGDGNRG